MQAYLFGSLKFALKTKILGELDSVPADRCKQSLIDGDLRRALKESRQITIACDELDSWRSEAERRVVCEDALKVVEAYSKKLTQL